MNKVFLTSLFALFAVSQLPAQNTVGISIDSATVQYGGDNLPCLPVRVDTFQSIAAAQFSIQWDTTELDFAYLRYGDNPLNLDEASVSQPASDQVWLRYAHPLLEGTTIAAGELLFELCFDVSERVEGQGAVTFDGRLFPEFVDEEGALQNNPPALPYTLDPGYISYSPTTGLFTPPAQEPDWAKDLSVYPNPARLTPVTIAGPALPRLERVEVFTAAGEITLSVSGDVRQLDLSHLPAGEYIVRLVARHGSATRTIIKL